MAVFGQKYILLLSIVNASLLSVTALHSQVRRLPSDYPTPPLSPRAGVPSQAPPPVNMQQPSYIDVDGLAETYPSAASSYPSYESYQPPYPNQPIYPPTIPDRRDSVEYYQWLPEGVIYKPYLASAKESRLSGQWTGTEGDSALLEGTLGGRFGLFRLGTSNALLPRGVQLDVEGSAQVRLDIPSNVDVRSVDFRAGVPLSFGNERHQTKFGYYHLSSHLGDEFLLKHPGFDRLNFSRDVLLLGHSFYPAPNWRVYAEAGWAFYSDVSEPWEFQFGFEYAPMYDTGARGAPFFAAHTNLRQELNFGGYGAVQAGWAWRNQRNGRLFRIGLHYFNGESSQFSFFDRYEHQVGFGIWYDQ